jgi:hypothetical protein
MTSRFDQPARPYWYHTHPHGESYRQALDGMSGAIVIDGIDRYVPEVRAMKERILILRDAEFGHTILILPYEKSWCNFLTCDAAHPAKRRNVSMHELRKDALTPARGPVTIASTRPAGGRSMCSTFSGRCSGSRNASGIPSRATTVICSESILRWA